MRPRITITALASSVLVLSATSVPATAATAGAQPDDGQYCMTISSGQTWCAPTEAGLDAVKADVLGNRAAESHLMRAYDQANKTGPYWDKYGTACDTDADADGDFALPSAWNDRISSFQGFSNCQIKLYEHGDLTGTSYGPTTSTNYVGDAINDKTSSVRVY
jgi:hypothetical protein